MVRSVDLFSAYILVSLPEMSSTILHTCAFCGKITDVSTALAAFIMNPCCAECGLSASESSTAMQNDLATLFAKQMSMGSEPPKDKNVIRPIVYSITQHYHHSSHVARQAATKPMDLRQDELPFST